MGADAAYGHLIGDRIMLHQRKSQKLKENTSINIRSFIDAQRQAFKQMNENIPAGVQKRPDYEASFRAWEADGHSPLT